MDSKILAWTYEGSFHCVACATARFGDALDDPQATDKEGNTLGPVFEWDEVNLCGDTCGTCLNWAVEPQAHEPASCLFGADCRQFEFAQ